MKILFDSSYYSFLSRKKNFSESTRNSNHSCFSYCLKWPHRVNHNSHTQLYFWLFWECHPLEMKFIAVLKTDKWWKCQGKANPLFFFFAIYLLFKGLSAGYCNDLQKRNGWISFKILTLMSFTEFCLPISLILHFTEHSFSFKPYLKGAFILDHRVLFILGNLAFPSCKKIHFVSN